MSKKSISVLSLVAMLALVMVLPASAATPSQVLGATGQVGIVYFHYTPNTITVHVGDTVLWHNLSHFHHTVDADDESFESEILYQGDDFSHTFDGTGTFKYHCDIHDFMHGTVVVLP